MERGEPCVIGGPLSGSGVPPSRRRLADLPGMRALVRNEQTRVLVFGVMVGVLGGLAAAGFDFLLVLCSENLLGTREPATDPPVAWRAIAAPIAGGLLAGIVIHLGTSGRRPLGISDVIEGIGVRSGAVSARDGLATALAAVLTVGTGHSAGREGPIVQLA